MKVKNVSDSFLFPIGNLVGDDHETIVRQKDESDEDYQKRSMDLRAKMAKNSGERHSLYRDGKVPSDEDLAAVDAATVELQASLDPNRVARFVNAGAKLPSDMVRVTMSLGSLVFDLFTVTAEQPKPPLAAALFARNVQNLAARLQDDEFELADDLLAQIRPALENEKKWETVNLTLYTMVGDRKAYLQVNHNAAGFFPNVMTKAVSLFMPNEGVSEETSSVEGATA